jgi:hypothetical protein
MTNIKNIFHFSFAELSQLNTYSVFEFNREELVNEVINLQKSALFLCYLENFINLKSNIQKRSSLIKSIKLVSRVIPALEKIKKLEKTSVVKDTIEEYAIHEIISIMYIDKISLFFIRSNFPSIFIESNMDNKNGIIRLGKFFDSKDINPDKCFEKIIEFNY